MDKWVKKILLILVVGFLLFFLFTRPEQAADVVKSIGSGFMAIWRFFVALAS